jgi:hypothetical protein
VAPDQGREVVRLRGGAKAGWRAGIQPKGLNFSGKFPKQEKVSHCCLTDTYVMPCGIPMVGSKVEGSHEALLDGQLDHVVDPNVPEEPKCFDVAHFRSRAAECWNRQQKIEALSAQQPRSGETWLMGSAQALRRTQDMRATEPFDIRRYNSKICGVLKILPLVRGERVPYKHLRA